MAANKPNQGKGNGKKPVDQKKNELSEFDKRFISKPAFCMITPLDWPPRPDIFDEVLLRKPITPERAHDAYMVWHLPDKALGKVWREWEKKKQRPYPRPPDKDLDIHVLAHNVYEHLMSDPLLPISYDEGGQTFAEQGLDRQYDFSKNMQQTKKAAIDSGGLGYLDFLDLSQLQSQCKEKRLDASGNAATLKKRITTYTMDKWSGMLLKTDISHWGVERADKYTLEPWNRPKATALEMYTAAIQISPYNPTYWVSRAYCHYQLGYFDLAIGDAYRAQLLCDVLEQSSDRNRRPGFYTRIWEAIEAHLMAVPRDKDGSLKPEVARKRKANGINVFVPTLQKALHGIISLSLAGLNAWQDYDDYMKILDTRLGMPDRDVWVPQLRKTISEKAAKIYRDETKRKKKLFFHEHSAGAVPASRPYPFENQDVDRTSSSFLDTINKNVFDDAGTMGKRSKPTCYAGKTGETQEIGVFAKSAIKMGAVIHIEEPTIRGHLPPRRLAQDLHGKVNDKSRCENCLKEITPAMIRLQNKTKDNKCPCAEKGLSQPGASGLVFCKPHARSKNKGCLEIAREVHHFSSCGKDWQWLYDSMRPVVNTWHDKEYISHTNEGHGTTLMLLLRNVFEIALHRRQQEPEDDMRLNAHEIDELLMLDGNSKSWRESWFPFNMAANIKVPFDILESLGVDIFQRPEFDTWIIQIILRKLLVNAVPWDPRRQGEVSDRLGNDRDKKLHTPEVQFKHMQEKESLTDLDPSFANLYLFPGLSIFNNSCADSHNADWGYDKSVPNRIIVWATKDIAQGEEIRIRYRNHAIKSQRRATRLLGGPCRCPQCHKNPPRPTTPDSENFTDQTFSSDEGEPEPDPWEILNSGEQNGETSESAFVDPSSSEYADTQEFIPQDEQRVAREERAVVKGNKVVIYRSVRTQGPLPPGWERKRKIIKVEEEPLKSRIIDIFGREIQVPTDPEERKVWARKYREEMRRRADRWLQKDDDDDASDWEKDGSAKRGQKKRKK
jgi:tetratricopeptide (TPR) repeat protein